MEKQTQFQSFAEFWPFYLAEHRSRVCRLFHYLGSSLSILLLLILLLTAQWKWLWLTLVVGYGFAWIGHFFFEHNQPATFKHPLWSFFGDWKMNWMALTGNLKNELEKLSNRDSHHSKA